MSHDAKSSSGVLRQGRDEPLRRTAGRRRQPDARASRHAAPLRPRPQVRRSDGVHRAAAIPWTRARATRRRQVSWLAGHSLMHAFPGPSRHAAFGPVAASQAPMAHEKPCASRYPLTVAGTAADLGKAIPSPHRIPD
ncbi:hypothetical protein NSU_0585 [Novosphingobium pentaromativorans US6-1]|uniref:Uncharacterized protein n=1 Tax=Novosphingobium pentaromativorans US6-1 TaxID=1088721 RepID=G6E8B4_9SPHN|nr:hypothetical protein NSU_0585 [Novosphingobium pentaromativorans US6-1]